MDWEYKQMDAQSGGCKNKGQNIQCIQSAGGHQTCFPATNAGIIIAEAQSIFRAVAGKATAPTPWLQVHN
eukprot:656086-Pelagomonas_calceolata.AAC.3